MCVLLLQYICKYIILHFIYIIIVYVKYYNVDTSVVESAFILVDKCSPILYHDVFIIYNLFGKSNLWCLTSKRKIRTLQWLTVDYIFTKKINYFSNMIYRFYFANIDIWAHLSVDVTESVFTMSCFKEIYKVVNYSWLGRIYNYIKYWVWVWWVKDSWTKMIFVALEIQEETCQIRGNVCYMLLHVIVDCEILFLNL